MSIGLNLERHKRHLLLKEIGGPGVQKLAAASVSIIGAGALGGPCAMYLAAAGLGRITLFDDDEVDTSNLQRQIQFDAANTGQPKAEALAARLREMNPDLSISAHRIRIREEADLPNDILIDATDNYETRFLLNEVAHKTGRVLVHGAAARWTGQASVFASGLYRDAPCYRCWVPERPPEPEACDAVGVAGPVTGIVGARMALEVIKQVTGAATPLIGKLWLLDGLSGESRVIGLRKDADCPQCSA